MSKNKKTGTPLGKKQRRYPLFSVTKWFRKYLFLVVGAFALAEEVPLPMTAVVFTFVAALPVVSALYVLICACAISVEIGANSTLLERRSSVTYSIRLKNRTIFPIAHVEADLSFPAQDGVTVLNLRLPSTIPPFGNAELTDTVYLPYHGRLSLAAERFYVYDFLRLFRIRRRPRLKKTIEIVPREVTFDVVLGTPEQAYAGQTERSRRGFDRSEQTDLRTYHAGDPVKDIHWKLSARSEELIVREYDRTSGQRLYVVADYSNYFHDPSDAVEPVFPKTIGRAAASAVAELSQAVALAAMDLGYNTYSVFRAVDDARTETFHLTSKDLHRALFRRMTFQCDDVTPTDVTTLALSIPESENGAMCFVLSHITEELVRQIQRFATLYAHTFGGRVLIFYADCSHEILQPAYTARFRAYQMKLLCRLAHTMEVTCVRELANGTMQPYHPADPIQKNDTSAV